MKLLNFFNCNFFKSKTPFNLYALSRDHTQGLVNYWPVVAGANTVMDVVTLGQLISLSPTTAPDRFNESGEAISVRDSNTYWHLPPAVYFSGDFTIMFWIKVYSCSAWSRFLDCGNGKYSDNVIVAITTAYGEQCQPGFYSDFDYSHDRNLQISYTQAPLTESSWTHLAWCVTGSTARVYMNGVSSNQTDSSFNQLPKNLIRSKCYFGKSDWDGDPYANADSDEIKFYDRGLSEAEIQHDFNSIRSFMVQI
jgi:hypothetical protein